MLTNKRIKGFISEINKLGKGIVIIKHLPSNSASFMFELILKANPLVKYGMLTPTDEYYSTITNIGFKWFCVKPYFNNTGTTFWFFVKE
jgi:hypothetical protein